MSLAMTTVTTGDDTSVYGYTTPVSMVTSRSPTADCLHVMRE